MSAGTQRERERERARLETEIYTGSPYLLKPYLTEPPPASMSACDKSVIQPSVSSPAVPAQETRKHSGLPWSIRPSSAPVALHRASASLACSTSNLKGSCGLVTRGPREVTKPAIDAQEVQVFCTRGAPLAGARRPAGVYVHRLAPHTRLPEEQSHRFSVCKEAFGTCLRLCLRIQAHM